MNSIIRFLEVSEKMEGKIVIIIITDIIYILKLRSVLFLSSTKLPPKRCETGT